MVRCADCGFLAMRHYANRTLDEAEEQVRQTGRPAPNPHDQRTRSKTYEDDPLCFARQKDLRLAIGPESTQEKARSVIQAEHDCGGFIKWTQGLSPKEHSEMMDRENLRQWQQEREDSDRAWRDNQAEREHKWRRTELKILLVAVIVAVVVPIVAAVVEGIATTQEPSTIIVQPSEVTPPSINVQPPEIKLEPEIIINTPTQARP